MRQRRMMKWLARVLLVVLLMSNAANVSASETGGEDHNNAEEVSQSEEADANTGEAEEESLKSEYEIGMKENSWRYRDGQPIEGPSGDRSLNDEAYHENATRKGIDVSEHNGVIDWAQVKASGIDFVIIRCGYGMDYSKQDDLYWQRNVSECERLGIPYGVYIYSYATDTVRAKSEAEHVLRLVQGHNLSYPIFFDMEDKSTENLSNGQLAEIADTFCSAITDAGYPVGVYANLNWWYTKLTDSRFSQWYRWVAQWNSTCTYTGDYTLWQYSDVGSVPGISGNVDMNYLIGYPKDHGEGGYTGPYTDIIGNEWFLSAVEFVTEAGVMDGLSEDRFGAYENLTRGQLVTSLWQMAGEPATEYTQKFPDVPDGESYTQAVLWASQNGIVGGYSNGYFGPNDNITREQLAKVIYAYAEYKGCVTSNRADISGYQDASLVSDFAQEAMGWIVQTGLIQGKSNNTLLDPQGVTTRAECAVIIERFMEPFADVKYSDWYGENVSLVYLSSLMTGTSDSIFSAGDTLARAQFATIVYRLAGEPDVTFNGVFPDVLEGAWYADAVIWANENGIITGYGTTGDFGPGDFINREQLATMLYRYAQTQGYNVEDKADLSGYPDYRYVNDFAQEAMQWCVAKGIITGDNGNLSPQKSASRAECATMVMRFLRAIK